jgi:hypothetical protein
LPTADFRLPIAVLQNRLLNCKAAELLTVVADFRCPIAESQNRRLADLQNRLADLQITLDRAKGQPAKRATLR